MLRGRSGWLLAAAGILAGALALRLWGIGHGLPYVYNADENAHFVPRAIGMFGHSYNPDYFVNPPAYTYLLHVALDLRFGGRAGVGEAMATDRTSVFELARIVAAVLGTLAVAFLLARRAAPAGRRGRPDRGRAAGGRVPARALLAPRAQRRAHARARLPGPARRRRSIVPLRRLGGYALGGRGGSASPARPSTRRGSSCSRSSPRRWPPPVGGPRVRGLLLAGGLALAGFVVANPYALLDFDAFRDGLSHQSEAAGDGGGKLGLSTDSGIVYYLGTATWGLGWLPALAALAGAIALTLRERRLALVLVPAPRRRSWSSWARRTASSRAGCCPSTRCSACWRPGRSWPRPPGSRAGRLARAAARRSWRARSGLRLCAQGLVFSIHNDVVLAREDTRRLARDWMVANVPIRSKVVIEPFVPAAWAADAQSVREGTGNGFRWNKWPTTRAPDDLGGGVIRFEDYERTTRPALLGAYARGGFCWVVTGSTQYGRAYAEPGEVPEALRYYAALQRDAELVYEVRPDEGGRGRLPFSYDFSFNAYPLVLRADGPGGPDLPPTRRRVLSGRSRVTYPPEHTVTQLLQTDHVHLARAIELAEGGRGQDLAEPDGRRGRGARRRGAGGGLPRRPRAAPTPSARRCATAATRRPTARRCTSRWSRAATRAGPRRARTRSSRPASPASSSPPTTRPRRPPAGASGSCATRASRSRSPRASSPRGPGCLNQPFRKHARTGIPWVLFKSAMTLDGKVATRTGDSKWISGDDSRRVAHRWRAECDAVACGIGTALADDPAAHRPDRARRTASRAGSCSTPRRACRWTPRCCAARPSCR